MQKCNFGAASNSAITIPNFIRIRLAVLDPKRAGTTRAICVQFVSIIRKVEVRVALCLTVSRSVQLGVETHVGAKDRILIFVWTDERTGLSLLNSPCHC
jgi:hypothetical protein